MSSSFLMSPKLEIKDFMKKNNVQSIQDLETEDVHARLNQLVLQSKETASKALEVANNSYINNDVHNKMETIESLLSNVSGFLDLCLEALDSISSEIKTKSFLINDDMLSLDIKVENEELDSIKQLKDCYVKVKKLSRADISNESFFCDTEINGWLGGSEIKSESRTETKSDHQDNDNYYDVNDYNDYNDYKDYNDYDDYDDDDNDDNDDDDNDSDYTEESENLPKYKRQKLNSKYIGKAENVSKYASQNYLMAVDNKVTDEEELLNCTKCDYSTTNKKYFEDHVSGGLKWRKCPWCSYHIYMKRDLENHLRTHYTSEPELPYKCIKCESSFTHMRMLEVHIKVHDIRVQFHCGKCDMSSNSVRTLENHREEHSGGSVKCDMCDHVAPGIKSLKTHKRKLHNLVTCVTCDAKFPGSEQLKSHVNNMHKVQCEICNALISQHRMEAHIQKSHRLHSCDQCDYTTIIRTSLAKHIARKHSTKYSYCEYCTYKTNIPSSLKYHIDKVHVEREMLECGQCGFKTKYKKTLKNHVENYHSEKAPQFLCEVCNKAFPTLSSVKAHTKFLHEAERTPCPTEGCTYSHYNKEAMMNHVNKVHKRLKLFCDVCNYVTHSKGILDRHKKTQHGDMVFKCDMCDFSSHQKSILKDHKEYVHLGITHPCDQCNFVARNKGHLKKHVKFVHLGIALHCEHCGYKTDSKFKFYRHLKGVHKIEKEEKSEVWPQL